MLEYYIQRRKAECGAGGFVQDKQGKKLYYLTGQIGRAGDRLVLYSIEGKRLAKIVQSSSNFGTHFDLYLAEEKKARMTKLINWPMQTYVVPSCKWLVYGDSNRHNYHIQNGNKTVMYMYPATTLMGDVFSLEIANEDDVPFCLCIAYVLDSWVQEKKSAIRRVVAGFPFPVV